MTLLPLGFTMGVKRKPVRKYWRSTPALLKSSGEASLGTTSPEERSRTSSKSISASSGWFNAEFR
ncbi:hypothetical protein D3C81_1308440 [compost metagenome]